MSKKEQKALRDIGNKMRLMFRLKRDQPNLFPLPADHEWIHTPLCQASRHYFTPCNCLVRLRVGTQTFE
jgi:hypothetical protein